MKRVVLPLLLLLFAAGACAAVFVIHTIEKPGSPIGVPIVTPAFSPNGDSIADVATISFRLRNPGRVTVTIHDEDDRLVQTVVTRKHYGSRRSTVQWDGTSSRGTIVRDGSYFATIDLAGERAFDVRSPIELDTRAPHFRRMLVEVQRATTQGIVRATVTGQESGVVDRWLELDGKRLTTLRIARTPKLRAARSYRNFFIAARLPKDTSEKHAAEVELVLVDAAGNRFSRSGTVVQYELPLPSRTPKS